MGLNTRPNRRCRGIQWQGVAAGSSPGSDGGSGGAFSSANSATIRSTMPAGRDEVQCAWRTCGFMLSRTSAGVSSWWLIPGFCRIERKIDKCGVASCCGGQGWGLRRSGLNGLRAAEGVAGIPHECVPGLFRVFSAFMAIYARFPGFSGGSPSGCFSFGIP